MSNETDINLYNNVLIFSGNKLIFEDSILYDFEDRYHNISSLGVDQQLQYFFHLVKMIYETSLSYEAKAETVIIFARIFKALSGRNARTDLLCIGESIFHDLFSYVISLYGEDNRLYDYSNSDHLPEDNFSVIIVNYDFIKHDFTAVLNDCSRLADQYGQIIFYGSGIYDPETIAVPSSYDGDLYQLGSSKFLLSLDMKGNKTGTAVNRSKEPVFAFLQIKKSELEKDMHFILSHRPAEKDEEWHQVMDHAINLVSQVETMICTYYQLFDNKDRKYETNEVKNALLDLKYEALLSRRHYDFFQSNLSDCYKLWVQGIS